MKIQDPAKMYSPCLNKFQFRKDNTQLGSLQKYFNQKNNFDY